jgi:hypothetical protein
MFDGQGDSFTPPVTRTDDIYSFIGVFKPGTLALVEFQS